MPTGTLEPPAAPAPTPLSAPTPQADPDLQAVYSELSSRGIFKNDPDAQAIGHELRARGVIVDPTQGGLVPAPVAAPQQPAAPSYGWQNGQFTLPPVGEATTTPSGMAAFSNEAWSALEPGKVAPLPQDTANTLGLAATGENAAGLQQTGYGAAPQPAAKTLPPEQWGTPGTPIFQDAQRLGGIVSRPVVGGNMTVATFGKGGPPRFYGVNGERLPVSDPRVAAYIGANPGATSLADVGQAISQIPEELPGAIQTAGENIKEGATFAAGALLPGSIGALPQGRAMDPITRTLGHIAPSAGNLAAGIGTLPFQAAQAGVAAAFSRGNPQAAQETAQFQQANINAAGLGPGGPVEKLRAGDIKGGVSQLMESAEDHPVEAVALVVGGYQAGRLGRAAAADGLHSLADNLNARAAEHNAQGNARAADMLYRAAAQAQTAAERISRQVAPARPVRINPEGAIPINPEGAIPVGRPGEGPAASPQATTGPAQLGVTRLLPPPRPGPAAPIVPSPTQPSTPTPPAPRKDTPGHAILRGMTRTTIWGGEAPDPIAQQLLKSKDAQSLIATIPEGSKPLDAGASSVVLRKPDGDVMRIGPVQDRPNIPEVLQPSVVNRSGLYQAETLPFVKTTGITDEDLDDMKKALTARGYEFHDAGTDNLGRTDEGRLVVTDPGSVRPLKAPTAPTTTAEPAKSFELETNPKALNETTWYHGTGVEGLKAEHLSSSGTNHESLMGQGVYLTDNPDIAGGYAAARSKKSGTPVVYEAKVDMRNVLNLEDKAPQNVRDLFAGDYKTVGPEQEPAHELLKALQNPDATAENLLQAFRKDVEMDSHHGGFSTNEYVETFQELASRLKAMGYDALTHTGGKRTGKPPHQVLVVLDPNDHDRIGRGPTITRFAPMGREEDKKEKPHAVQVGGPAPGNVGEPAGDRGEMEPRVSEPKPEGAAGTREERPGKAAPPSASRATEKAPPAKPSVATPEGWTEKQPGTVWHSDEGKRQIIRDESGDYTLYEPGHIARDFRTLAEATTQGAAKETAKPVSRTPKRVNRIVSDEEYPLYKKVFAKPQGLYFSIGNMDENPHQASRGGPLTGTHIEGNATAQNPLIVEPGKVEHTRFGWIKRGDASAGVLALQKLLPDEAPDLLKMSKAELVELLNKRFPGPDYSQYYDSYELLEALAGQTARKEGYDAIELHDPTAPEWSEYVALQQSAFKVDHVKTVKPNGTATATAPTTATAAPMTVTSNGYVGQPTANGSTKPRIWNDPGTLRDFAERAGYEPRIVDGKPYWFRNGRRFPADGTMLKDMWERDVVDYNAAVLAGLLPGKKPHGEESAKPNETAIKTKAEEQTTAKPGGGPTGTGPHEVRPAGEGVVAGSPSENVRGAEEVRDAPAGAPKRTERGEASGVRPRGEGGESSERGGPSTSERDISPEREGSANAGANGEQPKSPSYDGERRAQNDNAEGTRLTPTPTVAEEEEEPARDSTLPITPLESYRANQAEADAIAHTTKHQKTSNLVSSIRLLKRIEGEGRLATPAEQVELAKFPGWGWSANILHERNKKSTAPDHYAYTDLMSLLNDQELNAAIKAKLNSHYTDPMVISSMWTALRQMGFEGGNILEPSAGTGLMAAMQPIDMTHNSTWRMIELDKMTGRILTQLQQAAAVSVTGLQQASVPADRFDLAISNVPFGGQGVHDSRFDKRGLSLLTSRIHNYFFAKGLDSVRPGGLVAFITSAGTLNAQDAVGNVTRQYIHENAIFLGAIRLPNDAFEGVAGTEVTTDMVFLQKRGEGVDTANDQPFKNIVTIIGENDTPIEINEYFVKHPEMVLGTHSMAGAMYRGGGSEYTLKPIPGASLAGQIAAAIRHLPSGIYAPSTHEVAEEPQRTTEAAVKSYRRARSGTILVDGDKVFVHDPEHGTAEVETTPKGLKVLKSYVALREAFVNIIDAQRSVQDDDELKPFQNALKSQHDAYVKEHGDLHGPAKKGWLDDPDADNILALENWNGKTRKVTGLSDLFTKRVSRPTAQVNHTDSANDALVASYLTKGRVDMDYMSEITGKPIALIGKELSDAGILYKDPEAGWVSHDEYGSGLTRHKLKVAQRAALKDPDMQRNVDFLLTRQPPTLLAGNISAKLGVQWIPLDVYKDFVASILGASSPREIGIAYNPFNGQWTITQIPAGHEANNEGKWGMKEAPAHELIQGAMNSQAPVVYGEPTYDANGNRIVPVDPVKTANAKLKQQNLKDEWERWVYQNGERAQRLADIYNETINVRVQRKYDGSHLELPGANPMWNWYPHQKNAIWRTIQSNSVMYAHDVGTGKTATIIGSAMELRRIGLRNKPMIVCHNSGIEQMANNFRLLYPGARILVASKRAFEPRRRRQFLAKIASGDWDAVLITHSSFGKVPMHPDTVTAFYEEQITQLRTFLMSAKSTDRRDPTVRDIAQAITSLENQLQKKLEAFERTQDINLYWEDLGVDQLFVDEFHAFKNLHYMSQMAGMGLEGSDQAFDMYMKTGHLLENGGGLATATGTPITNSIAELHTVLRYQAPLLLKAMGMEHFDPWAQTFGEHKVILERTVSGDFAHKGKFASFANIPELLQLYNHVVDAVPAEVVPGLVRPSLTDREGNVINRPIVVESPLIKDQLRYFRQMFRRANDIRGRGKAQKGDDTPLKISTDGRHVSLDARLRVPGAPDDPNSKVNKLVESVLWEYHQPEAMKNQAAQVVFCDIGLPGEDRLFNVYDDIAQKLVAGGIPAKEIKFAQDAGDDDEKRQELFDSVNSGETRVLIGSRQRCGVGANIQKRLVAAHQLDPTWRPDWVEQADGRIIRQGNLFTGVRIYHYICRGSFDEFMWGRVAQKAKFIKQVTSGNVDVREAEDVDAEDTFNFQQIAAMASNNPDYIEWVNASDKLARLEMAETGHINQMQALYAQSVALMRSAAADRITLGHLQELDKYNESHPVPSPWTITLTDTAGKKTDFTKKTPAAQHILDVGAGMDRWARPIKVGEYRGYDLRVEKSNKVSDTVSDAVAKISVECQNPNLIRNLLRPDQKETAYTITLMKEDVSQLWSRINEQIDVSNQIQPYKARIARNEKLSPEMAEESKNPFSKTEELRQLSSRVNELKEKLGTMQAGANQGFGAGSGLDIDDEWSMPLEGEGEEEEEEAQPEGEKLKSLAALRIKPTQAFEGNILRPPLEGEPIFRAEAQLGFWTHALKPDLKASLKNIADRRSYADKSYEGKLEAYTKAAETATIPVRLAGYRTEDTEIAPDRAYFVDETPHEDERPWAYNAHEIAFIDQALHYNEVKRKENGILVFFKDGLPVAATAPLSKEAMELQDADEVRRLANKRPSLGAPTANAPEATRTPGRTSRKTESGAINLRVWGTILGDLKQRVGDTRATLADKVLGNAYMLERYGSEESMQALRELSDVGGQIGALLAGPGVEIHKLMRDQGGIERFLAALAEGRLRGIRERWDDLADRAWTGDVTEPNHDATDLNVHEDLVTPLEALSNASEMFAGVDSTAEQLARRAHDTGNDGALRQFLANTFAKARDNVATILGIDRAGNDTFWDTANLPEFRKALEIYKRYFEPEMTRAHIEADPNAYFTATLGPLGTYFPLLRLDPDGNPWGGGGSGFSSVYATGQADDYDTSVEGLRRKMKGAIGGNAANRLLQNLQKDDLLRALPQQKGKKGVLLPTDVREETVHGHSRLFMKINHRDYRAMEVPIGRETPFRDKATRKTMYKRAPAAVAPAWLVQEIGPALGSRLPGWGGQAPRGSGILKAGNEFGMAGPLDITFHSHNLVSTSAAEVTLGTNWRSKIISNTPITKLLSTAAALSSMDVMTPVRQDHLITMGKLGVLPERFGDITHDKSIAQATGAKYAPPLGFTKGWDKTVREGSATVTVPGGVTFSFPTLAPEVFGRTGLDARARILMFEQAMNLQGLDPSKPWPRDANGNLRDLDKANKVARTMEHLGSYVRAMESSLVRWLKDNHIGPFATAATTMMRNGVRTWLNFKVFVQGTLGLLAVWAILYAGQTGKLPWQDHNSRFLCTAPLRGPQVPKSFQGKEVNVGALLNPMADRGATTLGIRAAYDAYQQTHDKDRAVEAATKAMMNASIRPFEGPAVTGAFKAFTLHEPYVTRIRDARTGRPAFDLLPAVQEEEPGVSGLLQRVEVGTLGSNSSIQRAAAAAGFKPAISDSREEKMTSAQRWLQVVMDLGFPGTVKTPSSPKGHHGKGLPGLGGLGGLKGFPK